MTTTNRQSMKFSPNFGKKGKTKGDFASGARTMPDTAEVGDFASGEHALPTSTATGDFASGEHKLPATNSVGDFATGEHNPPPAPENPRLIRSTPKVADSATAKNKK